MTTIDRICLSYWFPLIEAAGLLVPETRIVRTDASLIELLDGGLDMSVWEAFLSELSAAAAGIGYPCFLRTGHTSGKHNWNHTCYLQNGQELGRHVLALVEYSHMVDFFGLPTDVWAVRKIIPTTPLFHAFDGTPIVREFRLFVRDGEVDHLQPYWPEPAIQHPSVSDWRERLQEASLIRPSEAMHLMELAERANTAVPGYWSVDFLQDRDGDFWLTDMAIGNRSFKWEPEKTEVSV